MEVPEVQYARSGDAHIAYQVWGEGPDLVYTPSGFNHLLVRWELPVIARYFRRLGSFARVIQWDKRGTGLSDRNLGMASLEEQIDDLAAVIDAACVERPSLIGLADGSFLSAIFAARYPDRVDRLILYGIGPQFMPAPDGTGVTQEFLEAASDGDPDRLFDVLSPTAAKDPAARAWWRRYVMSSASPGTVEGLMRVWVETDVRPVLPAITVPTTVMQRLEDRALPRPNGRVAADLIPGARYVEVPGDFSTFSGGVEELLAEIEEAVTGERHQIDPDRILTTILFTDIVGSTTAAAAMGDAAWGGKLDQHDAFVEQAVVHGGGRLVKSLGDGVLATFDSPAQAIRCARDMERGLAARGIAIRAGVHTGECERRGDDLGGLAVHIAARIGALAASGEVLVSGTVRDLVIGSGLTFEDRGEHELRGVPGTWRVLALT